MTNIGWFDEKVHSESTLSDYDFSDRREVG